MCKRLYALSSNGDLYDLVLSIEELITLVREREKE
jgi:hypothetical protein